jgi:AAA+ ATPase superfamily predicted ATPase
MARTYPNPFRYGDLALDEAFTDREAETRELKEDIRNGQNVVLFAPRRYGKSSLVWRATQQLLAAGEALVAQVDLLATPSKEKLAEKLATSIFEDLAPPVERVREKVGSLFSGLRITPKVVLDPNTGNVTFGFDAGHATEDVDATLERLFELPAQIAAERKKRVALVIDEFQEVVEIDSHLPALMRSIFQGQTEVAHVYLGSKRHMMERIFNDDNEPFWRSAKQMEIGVIPPALFAPYVEERFARTDRGIDRSLVDRVLGVTRGHPYATQELCYFLWEEVPEGFSAGEGDLDDALAAVLRSENSHFDRIWDKAARSHRLVLQALAKEPSRPISEEYRRRHGLPADATVRKAIRTLSEDELVLRDDDGYRIAEPFLAEWILRFES